MNHARVLTLAGLVAVLFSPPSPGAGAVEPIAIVYSLAGEASLAATASPRRPLRLFDRLPAGTVLEVGPGSRVALAFVNGLRYELGESARVTLGAKDLGSRTGPVRPLPQVPPLPRLSAIAAEDQPGARAGAVRIRREEIGSLSPRDGAVTLAGATVLRFQTPAGAARHEVEIEDPRGTVVFRTVTEQPAVSVPAGILAPGTRYHWTVKALDRPGPVVRGEADFVTLSSEAAESRERLRKAVEAMEDDGSKALLKAVDHGLGLPPENEEAPPATGAVIEQVAPGSAAERAGLQKGDELAAWSDGSGGSGVLRTPFHLGDVQVEQAPRGTVTLRGSRKGEAMSWHVPVGLWDIEARPALAPDLLALYEQGQQRIASGDMDAGAALWQSAIASLAGQAAAEHASWLEDRLAKAFAKAGRWPEADAAWESAAGRLEPQGLPGAAQILRAWGETLQQRSAWDRAEACYRRALRLEPEESLAAARELSALGTITRGRGDLEAAELLFRQAHAIREKLAPGSLDLAASLSDLAVQTVFRGNLTASEESFLKVLDLQQRLAPDSFEVARTLINLSNIASNRSDRDATEKYIRRAIGLIERIHPDDPELGRALSSLGLDEMRRGELAAAEENIRRALAVRQKFAPESLDIAGSLQNLGIIAEKRGDWAASAELHRRALEMREKLAPGSPHVSESLANLGTSERRKGDLAKADEYFRRALAIHDRSMPESFGTAMIRIEWALVAIERGDLALAEGLYSQALATLAKASPGSLAVSDCLEGLGNVALQRADLRKAEELFSRALEIREEMAPGSARMGRSLNHLGQVYRREGRLGMAAEHFCRATQAFDRQRKKLGGTTEGKLAFGGTIAEPYRDCLTALVDTGLTEDAFLALERGRARSFLDLLAERDMRWTATLPPKLDQDRKQADAEYDRIQTSLGRLSPVHDQAEVDRLLVRLRELRARQEEISEQIRAASPQTAALQDPQPLNLASARGALDPGTVLLSWSVGKERTFLFVLQPAEAPGPGLEIFPVSIGDAALRDEVESFRRLLKRPGSDLTALQDRARRLYDLLVRPAEKQISWAQRVLLSPDGPLHTLPFAALLRGDRYLVEWKPFHSALSVTVYAGLVRSRPAAGQNPGAERLAVFGDPVYPALASDAPADPELREAVRRGLALKPLPATRKEVEAVAALYPQAQVYLGQEATEERVKSVGPESRLIHFACHGLLDERFPLNSSLALTLPSQQTEGQDNGLLQAWEIFERLRLDADLVTLSACDTALGQEMGGEGLVGLTRAFQYAGARSVLASVWGVSDDSTARFMKRFYGYLRGGKTKDEALRAAQIDQIRGRSGSSHPFYWAAFQLTGDWK